MACRCGALVLPLFVLWVFSWLCPRASFAQDVRCWWNKGKSGDQSVSIECHADPPSFLQKCGLCQLHLITSENEVLAMAHRCTRNTANFTSSSPQLSPQAMQSVKCMLTCQDQEPGICEIKEGYSPPACLIPVYDPNNIHCQWTSLHTLLNPANFTLHWENVPISSLPREYHGSHVMGNNNRGVIARSDYSSSFHIKVWVTAESSLGSVRSEETVFYPTSIVEPLPPEIINHTFHPLEIIWNTDESYDTESIVMLCEVQYKEEYDLDWIEVEGTESKSFVLNNSTSLTKYMFHVRCGSNVHEGTIMSNWSSYNVTTPAGASSVGKLDACEPQGLPIPEKPLQVTGDSTSLTVSWSTPSGFSRRVLKYVVQHQPVGLLTKRYLVNVNGAQHSVTLRGPFQNYTAYNISLFAEMSNCNQLLQSAIAYTVQGVPPQVTNLHVTDLSSSTVNVTWEPIPLDRSRGFIRNYTVDLSSHPEISVGGDENSVLLENLVPGQKYQVWIRAETVAGKGEKTTVSFTKKTHGYTFILVLALIVPSLIILIMVIVLIACYLSRLQGKVWLKIPDPMNSSLFQQNNSQFRQSWLVPHSPSELALTIAQVDVLMVSNSPPDPEEELMVDLPEVDQQKTQPEDDRDHREERQKELQEPRRAERNDSMLPDKENGYRHAIDSSEEDRDDDDDNDWDGPPSSSDYEKHFLPSVEDT